MPCESGSGSAGSGGTPAPSGEQTGSAEDAYPECAVDNEFVFALATGMVAPKSGSLLQLTEWVKSYRDCIDELFDKQINRALEPACAARKLAGKETTLEADWFHPDIDERSGRNYHQIDAKKMIKLLRKESPKTMCSKCDEDNSLNSANQNGT